TRDVAVGMLLQEPDERAAHDDGVRDRRRRRDLLGGGDAEAERHRLPGQRLEPRQQRARVVGQRVALAGDAGAADRVHEAARGPRHAAEPRESARSLARWMIGPSARGSENGTPSSSTSTPAFSISRATSIVRSSDGSPAVTNPTKPLRPSSRRRRNRSPILVIARAREYSQVLVAA